MNTLIESALAAKRVTKVSIWWRRIFLLLNLTPPILLWKTGGLQPWAWIYAFLVHHALLAGLFIPRSTWLGPILNQLPTQEKIVWLTIDDGPSNDTVALAQMLGEMGVTATFFFQGNKLRDFAGTLATLDHYGHTVANHTQNHNLAWFWIFPPVKVLGEVVDFQHIATQMKLPLTSAFRCPAGLKNPFLHTVLYGCNLTLVGWTIRAYDGVRCNREKSLQHILSHLKPGAIILVHEGKNDHAGSPASLQFIRELVHGIHAAGYRFA